MAELTVESLLAQIDKLKEENFGHREKIRTLGAERSELAEQLQGMTADRDKIRGKFESLPGELKAENQRLLGEIRTRDHRAAFSDIVKDLHPKASVDTLWNAVEYKVGESIPTAEEINDLVGKARESVPYLFVTPADAAGSAHGATETPASGALLRSPGLERGATSRNAGSFTYRRTDLQDYAWVKANGAALAEAQANGTARRLD